ncbi:hypothetical protein B0H14DRAFT_2597390 [Mycena olivaceomarginata]|nr:hypothetical protein B0H14DRAFT_2597390 [Mycena olivaceomarginata]
MWILFTVHTCGSASGIFLFFVCFKILEMRRTITAHRSLQNMNYSIIRVLDKTACFIIAIYFDHTWVDAHCATSALSCPLGQQFQQMAGKNYKEYLRGVSLMHPAHPARHLFAYLIAHSTLSRPPTPTPTICYAVGGGAIVHSDLTLALAQFTVMSLRGPAELLIMEDARQATHFTSGFPRAKAALISPAEHASDMWLAIDAVEGQDVQAAIQVWSGWGGRWMGWKLKMPPHTAAHSRNCNTPLTRSHWGAQSPDHLPACVMRSQFKYGKPRSKATPKPAPKAPKPKAVSRRKQECSVPPVELEAAVESEDEDDTEAQEDDGPDELREEEKEHEEEHAKSPQSPAPPPKTTTEEEHPHSLPNVPPILPPPPKKPMEGGIPPHHTICLASDPTHYGRASVLSG